ncbi:hypothetical protein WJX84_010225, partial [Apatococcus fuscideae]
AQGSPGEEAEDEGSEAAARRRRRQKRKRKQPNEDELLENLDEAFGWLQGIEPQDQSWLHFAMFNFLEQQGEKTGAWAQLQLANQLQRKVTEYLPEQDERLLQMVRQVFPPAEHRQEMSPQDQQQLQLVLGGGLGLRDETPIFILGMARSGSTLLEQILASHSWGHGAGEDTAFAPLLSDLIAAVQQHGFAAEVFHEYARKYLDRMQAKAAEQGAGPPPPKRIVDKMLRNVWHVGYIQMVLPQACILQPVRHPLDVLLSCYKQPFEGRGTPWAWDLDDIAETLERVEEVMAHWQDFYPGKILRISYEHLVQSPEAAMQGVLRHCGMPWEPAVLDFHSNPRSVSTASLAQVRQKLYASSIGKWQAYKTELEPIRRRLAPLIDRYEQEWDLATASDRKHEEL